MYTRKDMETYIIPTKRLKLGPQLALSRQLPTASTARNMVTLSNNVISYEVLETMYVLSQEG